MKGTPRRKSIAYLCIAAVLLAALLPGLSALDYAVPEPGWILLPDLATRERPRAAEPVAAPSASFAPSVSGRAPPLSHA